MTPAGGPPEYDVAVVGDGPAGMALGRALHAEGLRTVVVGPGRPWGATYGAWVDELPEPVTGAIGVQTVIDVHAVERTGLTRRYGVFDLDALRAALDGAPRREGEVVAIRHFVWGGQVALADGDALSATLVVDATGSSSRWVQWPARRRPPAFQTAYGLVLDERPDGLDGDAAVLMDWRPPFAGRFDAPGDASFLYVIPLPGGGWLVEETSLARAEPMTSDELRARLAARLGTDLTDHARHVEHVRIEMGQGTPLRGQAVVGFGAAAGYVHPATGYSVTASLRAAPRVAAAIARAIGDGVDPATLAATAWQAVWPAEQRRARALHDYGLASLLRLPGDDIGRFFAAFFALPTPVWSAYLRVDTTPGEVARAMSGVFTAVPWSLRRKLAAGNPAAFGRLLR